MIEDTAGALSDLRVLEMGQLLAGPFCGQLLGDFGAEIIKVEPPEVGDPMRQWGREKPHGKSLWWVATACTLLLALLSTHHTMNSSWFFLLGSTTLW